MRQYEWFEKTIGRTLGGPTSRWPTPAHRPLLVRMFSTIAMSLGLDHRSPESKLYVDEFPFGSRVEGDDVQLVSPGDTVEQETAAREVMARQ